MANESVTLDSKAVERFDKALDKMRANMQVQAKLREAIPLCMKSVEAILLELAKRSGGAVGAEMNEDGALSVSANGRTLTFIPAATFAMDSHLHHARCMMSAQVLIFGHSDEERTGVLIGSFRVYTDGVGCNGSSSWRLDNSDGGFFAYLVELVAETLLVPEICWPHNEDFSDEVRFLPLSQGKADAAKLPGSCIGFACNITRPRVKK
jgi:hypothetical protein